MKIIKQQILLTELKEMMVAGFGNLVKAVVDTDKELMAIDGELHADEEALLLDGGSRQDDLWGINIYPGLSAEERIEFDSMINLKPWQGNMTRSVDDELIRKKIIEIVDKLVKE